MRPVTGEIFAASLSPKEVSSLSMVASLDRAAMGG